MPMMHVGKMNVSVHDGFVPVYVCVRLGAIPLKIVCVLVVRIMPVSVTVDRCIMGVFMFVMLAQMQPDTDGHEYRGNAELQGDAFAEEEHR